MGFNQGLGHQVEMNKIESSIRKSRDGVLVSGDKRRKFDLLEKARGTSQYPIQLEKLFNGTL